MRNKTSALIRKTHTMERKNNNDPSPKRLFTLKEAAQYLGRSEWSMRELIWAGISPVVKASGSRKIFIDIQDLDAFISRNKSIYR